MFGFLKRENPDRRALREEFETVTRRLRSADPAVKMAVGQAINLANSIFRKSFSVESFQSLPNCERTAYINKLMAMEIKLRDEKDLHSSFGFALFKM